MLSRIRCRIYSLELNLKKLACKIKENRAGPSLLALLSFRFIFSFSLSFFFSFSLFFFRGGAAHRLALRATELIRVIVVC